MQGSRLVDVIGADICKQIADVSSVIRNEVRRWIHHAKKGIDVVAVFRDAALEELETKIHEEYSFTTFPEISKALYGYEILDEAPNCVSEVVMSRQGRQAASILGV